MIRWDLGGLEAVHGVDKCQNGAGHWGRDDLKVRDGMTVAAFERLEGGAC